MAVQEFDIVVVPLSMTHRLYQRICREAQARGITVEAEARRMLDYAYDFEDAVNAHGRRDHPSNHDRLHPAPPDLATDENGVPL